MNGRRFTCFFLGAWLAASLAVVLVTTQNSHSVDRVMMNLSPAMATQVKALGPMHSRLLLRHHVEEQNRWYMRTWGTVQVFAGAILFLFLLFGTRERHVPLTLALVMFVVILVQRTLLVPEMTSLGRLLEFVGADSGAGDRAKLWVMEKGYYGLEILKGLMGLALAGKLIFQARSRLRNAGKQIDLIDKANYRHVDG